LNIIHIGNYGVGTGITAGLKKLGHNSKVLVPMPHPFGFKEDIILFPNKIPAHFKTIKIIKTFLFLSLGDVNIFHEHMLTSPLYNVLRLRNPNAKRVYHYQFSPTQQDEANLKEIILRIERKCNKCYSAKFVVYPMDLEVLKNSVWIPLPVDTETKKITEPKLEKNEVILGVGSDFYDKTKTKFLRMDLVHKAIENLENKGYKIKTLEFKGYKHDNVLEYWKKIDIWLDRFHLGFYGFTAPEAASCSIPILCEIDERGEPFVPECPFLRTKPTVESIQSNLEYLLSYSNREHVGRKCRDYVIQKHDIVKVAQKCVTEYKRILNE
jgi:hypothetical protein